MIDIYSIIKFWGNKYPIYVGFHQNVFDNSAIKLDKLMQAILELGNKAAAQIIPVVCSANDSKYLKLLRNYSMLLSYGLVIHLKPNDFKNYRSVINNIINSTEIKKSSTDIIVDLYRINPNFDTALYINLVSNIIKDLSTDGFRNIIFSASSFPDNLTGIKQNSISQIPRLEYIIWLNLIKEYQIGFGDYASDDPLDISLTKGATIIPTIRYTKDQEWYIVRGEYNPKRPRDFQQFHNLCKMLIARKDIYCNETHCWGDEKINECASVICKGINCNHGNLETWVKISTNHHLTFVANQISNYSFA